MADTSAGLQEIGTEVLSTRNAISGGLRAPIRGFRFTANFEGLGTTSFKSIEGFSVDVDAQEYREGGFGYLTRRKLPGLVNYNDIVLEKGMYDNPVLYNFFNDYLEGHNFTPVNATIIAYDNAGQPTASWKVINAWPKGYESNGLNAEDSSILVERLTLAHEGIFRDTSAAAA